MRQPLTGLFGTYGIFIPTSTTIGFPCAIFPLGYAIPIPWPRSQRGSLSSSQAEIHGTGAVAGGGRYIRDSMGVPARFSLEEVTWVGVFSCAENRVVSSTLDFLSSGKKWGEQKILHFTDDFSYLDVRSELPSHGMDVTGSNLLLWDHQIKSSIQITSIVWNSWWRWGRSGWIGGGYDDRCFFSIEIWIHRSLWQFLGKIPIHHTQLNPVKWRCTISDT